MAALQKPCDKYITFADKIRLRNFYFLAITFRPFREGGEGLGCQMSWSQGENWRAVPAIFCKLQLQEREECILATVHLYLRFFSHQLHLISYNKSRISSSFNNGQFIFSSKIKMWSFLENSSRSRNTIPTSRYRNIVTMDNNFSIEMTRVSKDAQPCPRYGHYHQVLKWAANF